jgi:hypothetical protein
LPERRVDTWDASHEYVEVFDKSDEEVEPRHVNSKGTLNPDGARQTGFLCFRNAEVLRKWMY